MALPLVGTRVVKTISPSQPGALKLARRYGQALVCVRYRQDSGGLYRHTTVELVVESVPSRPRPAPDRIIGVRLDYNEKTLHSLVRTNGAKWDAQAKIWRMPRDVAKRLGLLGRVANETETDRN